MQKKKLKELLLSKNSSKERTTQKNAWYFGVVKFIREMGINTDKLQLPLQLTKLQIENSTRYKDFTFFSAGKGQIPFRSLMLEILATPHRSQVSMGFANLWPPLSDP